MNWFTKFFGQSQQVISQDHEIQKASEEKIDVPESLFVNNAPPANQKASDKLSASPIMAFLEQDFYRRGYDDGYESHSNEVLQNTLKGIKADFRYNLNLKIDEMKNFLLKLQNHLLEISGLSEVLYKQLENQIKSVEESINELESQIALSSLDEGLVTVVLHQYRNGFIQGTSIYQQEKLIAGSTGLFN